MPRQKSRSRRRQRATPDPRERFTRDIERQPAREFRFKDLLTLTDASNTQVIHWLASDVIKPRAHASTGRGDHSRFAALDVIEAQLAWTIGSSLETIRGGVNAFRYFHRHMIALDQLSNDLPLSSAPSSELERFASVESRNNMALNYVRGHEDGPGSFDDCVRRATEKARVWQLVRTSTNTFTAGIGVPDWSHFVALAIGDAWSHVDVDPSPDELHRLINGKALVVDLVDVVFRVGEHCSRLGVQLGPW